MAKIINLEGLDGAGKSTLLKKLKLYLKENNIKFKTIHFPQTNNQNTIFGDLINQYLNDDLGDLDPFVVSTLFAGDRKEHKEKINKWLDEGYYVILDRYLYSNLAYQTSRKDLDFDNFLEWTHRLEYEINNIPKPDIVIYLDTPTEITLNRLKKKKKDKHEKDKNLQSKARKVYHKLSNQLDFFERVEAFNGSKILDPDQLLEKTIKKLQKNDIL
jgi:dTMP kinase